jgi:hypothetical protein
LEIHFVHRAGKTGGFFEELLTVDPSWEITPPMTKAG